MKVYDSKQTRDEYVSTQIARSEAKFEYCKVSIKDSLKYRRLLSKDLNSQCGVTLRGPVLCLGTRNGRAVDLFRLAFFGSTFENRLLELLEGRRWGFNSRLSFMQKHGRSRVEELGPKAVIGVEINPRAVRSDIWIGSFDQMPSAWTGVFKVVYSNAFDQSQDPERTAAEWNRVTASAGYLIIGFNEEDEPSLHDPVGQISLDDVRRLFQGDLIYYQQRGSHNDYSEAVIRRFRQ